MWHWHVYWKHFIRSFFSFFYSKYVYIHKNVVKVEKKIKLFNLMMDRNEFFPIFSASKIEKEKIISKHKMLLIG